MVLSTCFEIQNETYFVSIVQLLINLCTKIIFSEKLFNFYH